MTRAGPLLAALLAGGHVDGPALEGLWSSAMGAHEAIRHAFLRLLASEAAGVPPALAASSLLPLAAAALRDATDGARDGLCDAPPLLHLVGRLGAASLARAERDPPRRLTAARGGAVAFSASAAPAACAACAACAALWGALAVPSRRRRCARSRRRRWRTWCSSLPPWPAAAPRRPAAARRRRRREEELAAAAAPPAAAGRGAPAADC